MKELTITKSLRMTLSAILIATFIGSGVVFAANPSRDKVRAVLSPTYKACFGPNAPLDADSYGCLDAEYHRLDALLTQEYKSALARQPNDAARKSVEQDERLWWHTRFRACDKDASEFNGSTATVIHESCEIDALAQRILKLRATK